MPIFGNSLGPYQKKLKVRNAESVHHIELDYVTIEDREQAIKAIIWVNTVKALSEDLIG